MKECQIWGVIINVWGSGNMKWGNNEEDRPSLWCGLIITCLIFITITRINNYKMSFTHNYNKDYLLSQQDLTVLVVPCSEINYLKK